MRKLSLLAAAAMVAGGSAFAMDGGGVSISGTANFGVKFAESDDDSKSELQFHHEFDVKFSASGTTDGGIGFGGSMSIDNREDVTSGKVTAAKTGYIVKASDLATPAAQMTLEKKYGIKASSVSAGDVIESGVATSFSGFGKATIPGHSSVGDAIKDLATTTGVNEVLAAIFSVTPVRTQTAGAESADDLTDDVYTDTYTHTNVNKIIYGTDTNNEALTGIESVVISRAGTAGTDGGAPAALTNDPTFATGNTVVINYADGSVQTYTVTADGDDLPAATLASNLRSLTLNNAVTGANKVAISQAYIDKLSASVAASDKQKVNNHGEVYLSMDMHKLTIGSDLAQADQLAAGGNDGLADPGFDGIGIDDVAEGVWGKSAADVRYDGDFGVAKVAISYGDNAGDAEWAAGFAFNVEPVTFGAGFDSKGVMSVGMGFTQGAIAMSAMYSTDSDHDEADNEGFKCSDVGTKGTAAYSKAKSEACNISGKPVDWNNKPDLKNQAMGVDVSYQMSEATSVVLVAAQHKKESAHISYNRAGEKAVGATVAPTPSYSWSTSSTTVDAFGVGFSHDLGGGATLKAGAGSVDSNAVADLGITMKF